MGHHHHRHHDDTNLKWAFFLNAGFTIIEIIGGLWINSVAILSDAVHDLGDSLSLGFSWYMQRRADRPPSDRYTLGYRRLSLLGALVNSMVIILGSVFILHEAIQRLLHPEPVHATGMLWLSILGVAVNGYASYRVSKGHTMNEQVIYWHLLEDMLGWVAVFIASVILHFYDIPWIDPVLSIAIMLYILRGIVKSLRATMHLFLQGVPDDVDIHAVRQALLDHPDIVTVDQLEVWSLDGEHHVAALSLSYQPSITEARRLDQLREEAMARLRAHGITRSTIQLTSDALIGER